MTVLEQETYDDVNYPAIRLERDGALVRIVVEEQLTEAVAAAVRELLVDVCGRRTRSVVLVFEAELGPAGRELLPRLLDVAQRRCWSGSCRLDVTSSRADVLELLATTGF
ncbi:hypothetical protein ABZS29_13720 [Kribbella sp. NPDC005582]|uniref:hypothetical protein n=1 Tax=Kribbella sp. NPDC005582 TaxID=3156893 RepID=UPI0033BC8DBE